MSWREQWSLTEKPVRRCEVCGCEHTGRCRVLDSPARFARWLSTLLRRAIEEARA